MRTLLIAVPVVAVLAIAAGFAFFALSGDDAPPPPSLAANTTPAASSTTAEPSDDGTLRVAPGGDSFVGYRVGEEFIGVGVKQAVGRTSDVTGTVTVEGAEITAAELKADMTTLQSDEGRRDNALRGRGIQTDQFPEATFTLGEPVKLSRTAQTATGALTLHGVTKTVEVKVSGQKTSGGGVEIAGTTDIAFADFDIEPPSIAGFVTVEDRGALEFQLIAGQG